MPRNEMTSERISAIAARGARNPSSLTIEEIRAVCASALTQAKPRSLLQRIFSRD